MFRFHLLGLLHHGEAVHGYALIKEYNHRTGRRVRSGNAYRELRRLEHEGLVRAYTATEESPENSLDGLLRVSYEITAQGIHAFDEWFRDVPYPNIAEDKELAGRVIFFGDVPPDQADGIVAHWEQGLLEIRKDLERQGMRMSRDRENRSGRLLLQRRRELVSAELRFIEFVKDEYGLRGESEPIDHADRRKRSAAQS